MERDKQIEEMAKQICGNFGLSMPTARNVARYLIVKKGYRKASDVIDEFAERLKDNAFEVDDNDEHIFLAVEVADIDQIANEMLEGL